LDKSVTEKVHAMDQETDQPKLTKILEKRRKPHGVRHSLKLLNAVQHF